MNIFKQFKAMLRLREAIKKADEAYNHAPQRYYVMPTSDGKLAIMDKQTFRKLKRKHYIGRDVRTIDLLRECFFFTPYANGTEAITPYLMKRKRLQYFRWCDACAKAKKEQRKQKKG